VTAAAPLAGSRRRFRIGDHWGTAASLLAHGAVFGTLIWSSDVPPPSLAAPTIEMTAPMPVEETAETKNAPDVVNSSVKPPEVVQERPVETTQLTEARPDTLPEIKPDIVQTAALPEAEPEIEVIETRAVEPPVVVPPAPKPRPARQVAAPAPAPVAPPDVKPAPAPEALPVPPSPAPVGTHVAEAASGAAAGPPPDYLATLRAWLEKHKQYPQQAQRRRQQGTTLLRFTLSRDGRLLGHSIERSSGFESLDIAVGEMIERAAPLPPLPPDMGQDRLEIVVPIAFFLR
jgi:periplasmic protein TonB